MGIEELADLAVMAHYDALCLRASQAGIHSDESTLQQAREVVRNRGLRITMVTGDFDIVYNNERGPACLRRIDPYLDLATRFEAPLVRVALKAEDDIPWAQRAADQAAERGIRLVHQCHTQSLFETVEGIMETLRRINRPNFGLVYEPANLELCGQSYAQPTLETLGPWIFNVYLQNQLLKPTGQITLHPWCRGAVSFDLIPIHASGGIDFERVFAGLASLGYHGPITVHQASGDGLPPAVSATATAQFLRRLADQYGLTMPVRNSGP